jgi:SAM-dependent methyltransferase
MTSIPAEFDEAREGARIRSVYAERARSIDHDRYARTNPGHLLALQEREFAMAMLLRRTGLRSLVGLRILDLGCGTGSTLRMLLDYGADPDLIFGVDLRADAVREAQRLTPHLHFHCGNATELPYASGAFDFALQIVMFSSVLSEAAKSRMASEIRRVLKPGGRFLWYDFAYNNPRNRNVRGIKLPELRSLFPGFSMLARRITVAPPLGRALGRLGPVIYHAVSALRLLDTHYLCLLEKPSES